MEGTHSTLAAWSTGLDGPLWSKRGCLQRNKICVCVCEYMPIHVLICVWITKEYAHASLLHGKL